MREIRLFDIDSYIIDTSEFSNLLHDRVVKDFEEDFASYVGARYACSFNSASSAIFLIMTLFAVKEKVIEIPSILPHVVANSIINSGKHIYFQDDVYWVGGSYTIIDSPDIRVIDSAHRVDEKQFELECDESDDERTLMIFSFYPTKPVGSCDGGMVVSNSKEKIDLLRSASMNGVQSVMSNSWNNKIDFIGWKMYMNSIQAYIAYNNLLKLPSKKRTLEYIRNIYNSELGYDNTSDHLYRIKVNDNRKFIEYMLERGIQCGIHYKALHLNKVYGSLCHNNNLEHMKKSEEMDRTTVSIPFHHRLSMEDVGYVMDSIEGYK